MVDHEVYSKLVQAVELTDIALMELRHRRREGKLESAIVETAVKIQRAGEMPSGFAANVEFDLRAMPTRLDGANETEVDSPDLKIQMLWRLEYAVDSEKFLEQELTDELIDEFIERNVPINVWPYIRETVANLTGRMGVNVTPLLLPTLKIVR